MQEIGVQNSTTLIQYEKKFEYLKITLSHHTRQRFTDDLLPEREMRFPRRHRRKDRISELIPFLKENM